MVVVQIYRILGVVFLAWWCKMAGFVQKLENKLQTVDD